MHLNSRLAQASNFLSRNRVVAFGFLGIPALVLSTILVRETKGATEFTVLLNGSQGSTYSLWLLPLFGVLAWVCSLMVGTVIASAAVDGRNYLALTLWWSGIGIELLCLAVILSYL